jgi:hypothetical protein
MKILKLIILLFIPYGLIGQASSSDLSDDFITREQYGIILKKRFTDIANNSDKTTIGNYAAADIKDGKLAFNATKNFKNGDFFSFNANGSVTDGLFSIFTESSINSNAGADFKYSHLFVMDSSISYHEGGAAALKKKLRNIESQQKLRNQLDSNVIVQLQRELVVHSLALDSLKARLSSVKDKNEIISIELEIAKKSIRIDSIKLKLSEFPSPGKQQEINLKLKKKQIRNAIESFEPTGLTFQWISIGAGFLNNNFKEFRPTFTSLDSQVVKRNYTTGYVTFDLNFYRYDSHTRKNKSFYLAIGTRLSIDDNFSDLSKVELNDVRQYGDTTVQRSVTQKNVAYQGDYKTGLIGGRTTLDFYKFIRGNNMALHLFPEVNYRQHSFPVYNAGIGVLYAFKDAKDKEEKTVLNAELYFRLSDLTNKNESQLSTFERNELGLRLSIPIAFFNF